MSFVPESASNSASVEAREDQFRPCAFADDADGGRWPVLRGRRLPC